jgi:hypothetical protein
MRIDTKEHFSKLSEIIKEDGFKKALDYDYQVTRMRHPLMNWFFEDVEYLVPPVATMVYENHRREHISKHYTAVYSGEWGKERLVELYLK